MTELTELFPMDDMDKLKCELSRLVRSKDYKTINTFLRRNPNTWKLNTRVLNEEILCDDRHFTKQKCVLKFETKTTTNNTCKVKRAAPVNDTYEAHLYNPNDGSYGYISPIRLNQNDTIIHNVYMRVHLNQNDRFSIIGLAPKTC